MAIDQLSIVLNHPHAAVWSIQPANTLTRWYVGTLRLADGRTQTSKSLSCHSTNARRASSGTNASRWQRPSLSDLYAIHLYMCLLPAYTSARLVVAESLSKSTAACYEESQPPSSKSVLAMVCGMIVQAAYAAVVDACAGTSSCCRTYTTETWSPW